MKKVRILTLSVTLLIGILLIASSSMMADQTSTIDVTVGEENSTFSISSIGGGVGSGNVSLSVTPTSPYDEDTVTITVQGTVQQR